MAAAFAQRLRQLFLRVAELFHQLLVTGTFVDRVQVRPLDVFDDRDLEHFDVVVVTDDNGHFVQLGHLGGAPAAFACNNFVSIVDAAHDQRLDDALFRDGGSQFVQRVLCEMTAGLIGVGLDLFDGHHHIGTLWCRFGACICCDIRHQGGQAAPQSPVFCRACHIRRPSFSWCDQSVLWPRRDKPRCLWKRDRSS